ncbi:MAG TPA: aminodeoxychorismate synthase, component I, partial [Dokdonella sp.]|nr:aminodeoxychorismate synthase, component I [Dokdonella sp.]
MPSPLPARRELAGRFDLLALAARHPDRYPGLLESVAHGTPSARFDVLAAFPQQSFQLDRDGQVRDGHGSALGRRFLDVLDEQWRASHSAAPAAAERLPFHGGWLLYLGYELAAEIEPRLHLPLPASRLPLALALRCPVAAIVDHRESRTTLLAEAGFEPMLALLEADLRMPADCRPMRPAVQEIDEDP